MKWKTRAILVMAALAALLLFLFLSSKEDEPLVAKPNSPSSGRSSVLGTRPTLDGTVPPLPDEVPEGSVIVRRVLFDELREAAGQTPAVVELNALDDFRRPTAGEVRDPQLQALYSIDREIHRRHVLSRHEKLEVRRFLRDAEREQDDEKRAVLASSARLHEVMAWNYGKQVGTLMIKRAAMATEIYARGNSAVVVADQTETPTQKEDL